MQSSNNDLKQHGQDISKIVPKLVKDTSKIPEIILDSATEYQTLEDSKSDLTKDFKCDIEIIYAKDSKENKAKQAMPAKPAILVE